jgi:hypothetical protein
LTPGDERLLAARQPLDLARRRPDNNAHTPVAKTLAAFSPHTEDNPAPTSTAPDEGGVSR